MAAKNLPVLEELTFRLAAISEQGYQAMAGMPNLRRVEFQQILSQQDMDRLREVLPHVEFTFAKDEGR